MHLPVKQIGNPDSSITRPLFLWCTLTDTKHRAASLRQQSFLMTLQEKRIYIDSGVSWGHMVPICLHCLNCTKFGQLILWKTIKIVATKGQFLRLKCTKFDFGWGSAPDPAGGAYSAPPDPLAGFKGPTSKGWGGEEEEGRRKGREGKGEEKEGNRFAPPPSGQLWIRHCLVPVVPVRFRAEFHGTKVLALFALRERKTFRSRERKVHISSWIGAINPVANLPLPPS